MRTHVLQRESPLTRTIPACSQGRALLKKLDASNEFSEVLAISRGPLDFKTHARVISLDLKDRHVRMPPADTAPSDQE